MSRNSSRPPRRRSEGRFSPFAVGLFALLLIAIGTFLGFTKDIPFTSGYRIKAVFESANSLRPNSPVRIAGVNVGKVKSVTGQEGSNAAIVEMEISEEGLPIHKDATAKIRPRIFLEGNFFVDLRPGTPSAPELEDGDTIRITQTSRPVQLDEVLTSLQEDTREDLKVVLDEFGKALSDKPTAAQDRDNDRDTRGQTAAESLNDAATDAGPALRAGAQVNAAFLGVEPDRDTARLLRGFAATAEGLTRNEQSLKDLVTNFNRTMAAFAAEETNLRASIRELAPTLEAANPALDALNASFPSTRALARELIPGVRETPASIAAARPFIREARLLLGEDELRGAVRELAPATSDLARFTDAQINFLPQLDLIQRCALDVLLPTGDVVIKDEFTTGVENYKEFAYGLVGLASEGQNFDGNGQYVRFQAGGGTQTVSLG
jgi:virulence factor Mce-like protein